MFSNLSTSQIQIFFMLLLVQLASTYPTHTPLQNHYLACARVLERL